MMPDIRGQQLGAGNIQRLCKTGNTGDMLRAGPMSAFLVSPVEKRLQPHPLPHVQCACSFRTVYLVCRQRKKIRVELVNIKPAFSRTLHSVHVKKHTVLPGNAADLFYGLDDAGFVVHVHDAYKKGFRGDGGAYRLRGHLSAP